MIPRILEPELMDTPEEARDYDAMDHTEVNRRFVDDLLGAMRKIEPCRVILDLGTGTALIPIELCGRCARARIVAVDAAEHMLRLARENIEAAGFKDRIQPQRGDAKRLPVPDRHFDCVISNSIVHHLPEPIAGLREAVRVTRPGGLQFIRDLMRPASEDELNRLVDLYAPPPSTSAAADHQRAMFAASLHAALTLDEIRGLAAELGYPGDTAHATSDRHWTWCAKVPEAS